MNCDLRFDERVSNFYVCLNDLLVTFKMVKKRKSSVANTPQRDGGNSKKVKVDEKAPDVDENVGY